MSKADVSGDIPSRGDRKRRNTSSTWRAWLLVPFLLVICVFTYFSCRTLRPLKSDALYLAYMGEIQDSPAIIKEGEPYVPLKFIQEKLDPHAHWDPAGVIVVTTKDKVIKLKTDSLTAYVNQHPARLQFPVTIENDEPYVPAHTLEVLYPVTTVQNVEVGMFTIKRLDRLIRVSTLTSDAILRTTPSIFGLRSKKVMEGEKVNIYGEEGRWVQVETEDGLCGFITANHLGEVREEPPLIEDPLDYVPKPLRGDKVVLAWEQVYSVNPDTSKLYDMPGLNVVSPTWFHLADDQGEIENRADITYVNWAHSKGYQVWALFSNSFDPEITSTVLRSSELRDKVISQILIHSRIYKLDGINIDFENVNLEDGPYLTQFVREMTPLLHEQGLTVSIDITVKSKSPNWSLFLERDELSQVVDYVMLMSYDQYPQGSTVPGPVSSIPWTESNIIKTLEEVPNSKLVLGIPFYTRLWTETKEDGTTKVTSKALGMKSISDWLAREGVTPWYDPETGLFYGEKTIGNATHKVWIEDDTSVTKRLELVKKYDLAGVAAWSRGFETEDIWETIDRLLR